VVDHDLAHVMGSLGRGVGQERLLGVCFDEGSSQDGSSASGGDVFMLDPKGGAGLLNGLLFGCLVGRAPIRIIEHVFME